MTKFYLESACTQIWLCIDRLHNYNRKFWTSVQSYVTCISWQTYSRCYERTLWSKALTFSSFLIMCWADNLAVHILCVCLNYPTWLALLLACLPSHPTGQRNASTPWQSVFVCSLIHSFLCWFTRTAWTPWPEALRCHCLLTAKSVCRDMPNGLQICVLEKAG